ncbi:hypothetical protein OIU77_025262 [Salix suchowensis]|uniref:Interferon-related developmental regulator 1 n=1 Tax=Salix suchowensis TaxID=1278906 RepID=A0ABQ9BXR4_9ROSI|nr:hypothetical protein OIU77_025262 [Salix suchowensis]
MGRRKSQRKNVAMLDSDEDNSSIVLLEQALDALYEKRGSTREKALAAIIEAFNTNLPHQFVEKKFATLLHQCLNSIKKGSSKEIALACHAIGLLALTVGSGDNAREILDESVAPISHALKSSSDSLKTVSLLECLAVVTFVSATETEETERSMQIMWRLLHPKLGSNVVAVKTPAAVVTAVVSTWAFLLTTMDGCSINSKDWQESISYFSTLLDKDDRSVRISAGEALALIFETGIEKLAAENKTTPDGSVLEGNKYREGYTHILARGTCSRMFWSFWRMAIFLIYSMKIGGDSLQMSTWSELIQLNFLKHFLGGGFVKHMQDNELLHDVFGFTPKRKHILGVEHQMTSVEKRMFQSPNSVHNKARTQLLNKQRMLSKDRNVGHFAVGMGDEDSR